MRLLTRSLLTVSVVALAAAVAWPQSLAEIAARVEPVRVVVVDGRAIVGSVDVVATDHIELSQDGNTIVVPIRQVVAVIRSTSRF